MKFVFQRVNMQDIVDFAMQTLREMSPVGQAGIDPHPGLYRDSHMVFLNGHNVKDVSAWKPGDLVEISNPVPYSRKLEVGKIHTAVAPHIYQSARSIIADHAGSSVAVVMSYMPVRFGDVQAWANTGTGRALAQRLRRANPKLYAQWLVRQPTLTIKAA